MTRNKRLEGIIEDEAASKLNTCEVCIEEARAEQVRAFEVRLPQYRLHHQEEQDSANMSKTLANDMPCKIRRVSSEVLLIEKDAVRTVRKLHMLGKVRLDSET